MLSFLWDYENITHIAEHNVSPDEVEFALQNGSVAIEYQDWHAAEERFAELGLTFYGRLLYIVTTIRGSSIRVITAYDAPKQLGAEYFKRR